jgi:hypothetical protein
MTEIELREFIERLPPETWLRRASELQQADNVFSTAAFKYLCRKIRESIESGLGARTRDLSLLGLTLSRGSMGTETRFRETLRPSSYRQDVLRKLHFALSQLSLHETATGSAPSSDFLSLANYVDLWQRTRTDENHLFRVLAQRPSLLTWMLILAEESFHPDAHQPSCLSAEDIAAAVSFVLARYDEAKGLQPEHIQSLPNDASAIASPRTTAPMKYRPPQTRSAPRSTWATCEQVCSTARIGTPCVPLAEEGS